MPTAARDWPAGPWLRVTLPLRSTASPPRLTTSAVTRARPLASREVATVPMRKSEVGAPVRVMSTYMRMPTRLTRSMPLGSSTRTAVQATAYRSPSVALIGGRISTWTGCEPPAGMSIVDGETVVHELRSLAVRSAANVKASSVMAAAAGYSEMC